MQYIITECKKINKGRVDIVLDGRIRFWLYAGEARQLSLEEGKDISKEQYQQILHGIIGKRAIKRAMHILERQERTEYQLREKLMQGAYPKEAVEEAVDYVRKFHYLDDERYARTFIHYHQKERSKKRLELDLMKRGVPKDTIKLCIEEEFETDEKEQICHWLEKKQYTKDTADQKERAKMYQFLARRGFSHSDIMSVLR